MSNSAKNYTLKERVAALEERTRPKKATFFEKFRSYGGLIALVITIGYSWPLGVWDRFVITPAQKEAAQLAK